MSICIIKLGALGDVVRTLPLLLGIKEKYPDSEISWVTKKESAEIVENSPYIKKFFLLPFEPSESFDILYNFDVDDEATSLAMKINAAKKYGFSFQDGFASAFNIGAEYYLNTMFDDHLKKTNKKTYQEMMFMAADMRYKKQHHGIELNHEHKMYADNFFNPEIENKKIIGIHIGASSRWPSKVWHKDNLREFIEKAKSKNFEVIVFGGPNETEEIEKLKKETNIRTNNPNNTNMEFASVVDKCDFMICPDSFSLHISLALNKPTIGLFFCTPPDEVESYGLLKKIVSKKIYDFFPERMNEYNESLVKSISPEEVLNAIMELEERKTNKRDNFRYFYG